MFSPGSIKKGFTIEALVGKDAGGRGGSGDEPIRPTALRFPDPLHAASATGVFGSCFQGGSARTLYPGGQDVVLQDPGTHAQGPGGLPLHALQIPQRFFSAQPRDALSFYPWVLRRHILDPRFQGEPSELPASKPALLGFRSGPCVGTKQIQKVSAQIFSFVPKKHRHQV